MVGPKAPTIMIFFFLLKSPLRDALCQVPNQISNVFLAIDFGMT